MSAAAAPLPKLYCVSCGHLYGELCNAICCLAYRKDPRLQKMCSKCFGGGGGDTLYWKDVIVDSNRPQSH